MILVIVIWYLRAIIQFFRSRLRVCQPSQASKSKLFLLAFDFIPIIFQSNWNYRKGKCVAA